MDYSNSLGWLKLLPIKASPLTIASLIIFHQSSARRTEINNRTAENDRLLTIGRVAEIVRAKLRASHASYRYHDGPGQSRAAFTVCSTVVLEPDRSLSNHIQYCPAIGK